MPEHVSPDNFIRAETDVYFGGIVGETGLGRFLHYRDVGPLDHQLVVRQNRDTLYSAAVFDVDAGPVTVTNIPADLWQDLELKVTPGIDGPEDVER